MAYGLANIAGLRSRSRPNGLGVMEATLSGILVGFGTPRTIAIWGVIAWRLVNFWLPIPLGRQRTCRCVSIRPRETQAGSRHEGPCGGRVGGGRSSSVGVDA